MSMAEGDNSYEKYLEKNYDSSGNVVERYKQKADDSFEAEQINKRAQVHKERQITERLLEKEAVTKEESCNKAIRDTVKLTIDGQEHDFMCPQTSSRDSTTLMVEENGQSSNGLYMATVGDTKMLDIIAGDKLRGKNIVPFSRNCSLPPDRKDEIDRIKNNLGICKSRGTCTALMKLSDEWENVPSETDYLTYKDDGKEEKSGINMMSMLFCKHGGLITPVTSGQIQFSLILGVSDKMKELLKKYETGLDSNGKLLPEGNPALFPYHSPSDAANVLTIGWGHAMSGFDGGWFVFSDGTNINLYNMYLYDAAGTKSIQKVHNITQGQAEEILDSDIAKREKILNEVFKKKGIEKMINQQFYDVLFLLTYPNVKTPGY